MKNEKRDNEGQTQSNKKKASAAQLRITKDINELELPKTCRTEFPDPDDLLQFKLIIYPDEGFYRGGRFHFHFKIGTNYPYDPPKVKCENKVYHPNIDLDGNVCLNILREDWKPVLTINSIVYGLQYLFLEPNPEGKGKTHYYLTMPVVAWHFYTSIFCHILYPIKKAFENASRQNSVVFRKCRGRTTPAGGVQPLRGA